MKSLGIYSEIHGPKGRQLSDYVIENVPALWDAVPETISGVGNTGTIYTGTIEDWGPQASINYYPPMKMLWFRPHVPNNAFPVISISGLPPLPIIYSGTQLTGGELSAGVDYFLRISAAGDAFEILFFPQTAESPESPDAARWAELPHVEDWRGYGGDNSDTAMIQAAVAEGNGWIRMGKAVYTIEDTIVIKRSGVGLEGRGQGGYGPSSLSIRESANTRLFAGSGFTGPLVSFTAIAGLSAPSGGGLKDLMLDGNLTAQRCLELLSWRTGTFENLFLYLAANGGENLFLSQFPGVLASEPYDCQRNRFVNVNSFISPAAGRTAYAGRFTGGYGNGFVAVGNTSLNSFYDCIFQSADQTGLLMENCDTNWFFACSFDAQIAGQNGLVLGSGDEDTSEQGGSARSNQFHSCVSQGTICKASQTGGVSSHDNVFYGFGRENGNAYPEIGIGAGGSKDAECIIYSLDQAQSGPYIETGYLPLYDGAAAGATWGASLDISIMLVPFRIDRMVNVTSLNLRVQTGVPLSLVRMAIWESDPNTGRPLLVPIAGSNTAQSAETSNSTITVAIAKTLHPALYWYGVAASGALPNLTSITNTSCTLGAKYGRATMSSSNLTGWWSSYIWASTSIMNLNLTATTQQELNGTAGVPVMYLGL